MKAYHRDSRKRAVNLTSNEDLVQEAKVMTDNLSGVERVQRQIRLDCGRILIALMPQFDVHRNVGKRRVTQAWK